MLARATSLVFTVVLLSILATPTVAFADSDPNCSAYEVSTGLCPSATVGSGSVELEATVDQPATGGGASDYSGYDTEYAEYAPAVNVVDSVEEAWCDIQRIECVPWTPPADDDAAASASAPITISDVATFRPQPTTAAMQPNQWMIVGLDTNFYATASAHVVDGTLFGGTAQVRFTPVRYSWDYGDGTTASLESAGATWAKQKITEFDPTPTSHVFSEPGNYTITLSITYRAEYRVAGIGWRNVIGTLTINSAPLTATAGHATTVLVDQDCIANPTGIGC